MFRNGFTSRDFAMVLLVDEMSSASLMSVIRDLMESRVSSDIVIDLVNIQREGLGLEKKDYMGYIDLLGDEILTENRKYYGKCEELKIVLLLYLVEHRESGDGNVDMLGLLRKVGVLRKFVYRIRGVDYQFSRYESYIKEKM